MNTTINLPVQIKKITLESNNSGNASVFYGTVEGLIDQSAIGILNRYNSTVRFEFTMDALNDYRFLEYVKSRVLTGKGIDKNIVTGEEIDNEELT